jgi:hypothetical protein
MHAKYMKWILKINWYEIYVKNDKKEKIKLKINNKYEKRFGKKEWRGINLKN